MQTIDVSDIYRYGESIGLTKDQVCDILYWGENENRNFVIYNEWNEVDIEECVTIGIYDEMLGEHPDFLLYSELDAHKEYHNYFNRLTKWELLGWCVSLQAKVFVGMFMASHGYSSIKFKT